MKIGESYSVGPTQFYKHQSVWSVGWFYDNLGEWDDNYCFVDLSLDD